MQTFSKLAADWLAFYGLHAIETSLFVLAVFGLARLVKHDVRLRYALFVIALLKVFVPPLLAVPEHISNRVAFPILLQAVQADSSSQAGTALTLPAVLFVLWCLSVAALLSFILLQNLKLRRRLRHAVPMQISANSALSRIVPGELNVLITDTIRTPLLLGVIRPKLYLPKSCENWHRRDLNSVVAHEIAHYANRDVWLLLLQTIALVLFSWNPLIWRLHRELTHLRELRCDEIAIAKTGIAPLAYSKILYNFLEQDHFARKLAPSGAYFAQSKDNIFGRLQHILSLDEKTKSTHKAQKSIVFALAALIFIPLSLGWRASDLRDHVLSSSQDSERELFVAYDQPPQPVGGFAAVQKNLIYPTIARKAGIEGRVVVNVLVSERGEIDEVKILQSLGDNGCDKAAIAAVKSTKWQPALSNGKPVKVWVGIPIIFKLS